MAHYDDFGLAVGVLDITESSGPDGAVTIDILSELYLETDSFGFFPYSQAGTYFQVAVQVTDQPYEFQMASSLVPGGTATEINHYVHGYNGTILVPNPGDWYLLAYGDLHYRLEGGSMMDVAYTEVALTLAPVPVPGALTLLALGWTGLAWRIRKP